MKIEPFNYRVCIAKDSRFLDNPHLNLSKFKFKEIPNTLTRWAADPFIISNNGKTYVFAELGTKYYEDRGYSFGSIGYKRIGVKYPTFWHKCIKNKTHMSFPNVFEHNGTFYMIPETYRSNSIFLFKAISFPKKWEEIKTILEGPFVDTSIFKIDNRVFLLTYRLKCRPFRSELYEMVGDSFVLHSSIPDRNSDLRLAGQVRVIDNTVYVYTQDCSQSYGKGIILNQLDISEKEHSFKKIENIDCMEFDDFHTKRRLGLHTINFCGEYCCIDVMYHYRSPYALFRKILRLMFFPFRKALSFFKHKVFRK